MVRKNSITAIIGVLLLLATHGIACAQSSEYAIAVQAKHVAGNGSVSFDIHIENTSAVALGISECDFMFDLGLPNECEDVDIDITLTSDFSDQYDVRIPEVNPVQGRAGIAMYPTVQSADLYWLQPGEEVHVGSVFISSSCKQLFPSDVTWSTDGFFQTLVYVSIPNVQNEVRASIIAFEVESDVESPVVAEWQCNPTPTTSVFHLSTSEQEFFWERISVVFFDLQGSELAHINNLEVNGVGATVELDLPATIRQSGTYIISIRNQQGQEIGTAKCIVVR